MDELDKKLKEVKQGCDRLSGIFIELTVEVFHYLASELRFIIEPLPGNDTLLQIKLNKVKPHVSSSLGILQPADHLSLKDLLKLRDILLSRFIPFDQLYQEVIAINRAIPRSKYEQRWKQLHHQLQTLRQQINALEKILGKPDLANIVKQRWEEICDRQHKIKVFTEDKISRNLEEIKQERGGLQKKLEEVLARAIVEAKLNKVKQDSKLGE